MIVQHNWTKERGLHEKKLEKEWKKFVKKNVGKKMEINFEQKCRLNISKQKYR